MMMWDGLEVDQFPKFLDVNPTVRHHSILLPALQLRLPIVIKDIIYYLPTRSPDSIEEGWLDIYRLIPNTPYCNHHDQSYSSHESNMVYYRGGVRNRKNIKSKIFGLNLYPVPELQLNGESIYEYEVCAFLTEVNPTLNMNTFTIYLND